jgi:hypothetical protein
MAAIDTIRERIILFLVAQINEITAIEKVVRRMPSYSDLTSFSSRQFPAVAVIGRLPVPVEKHRSRDGDVDRVKSSLRTDIYVYFQDKEDPDSTISNLMNELWKKLYTDQTKGGLCLSTELKPNPNPTEYMDPYGAFALGVDNVYIHTPGGI